MLKLNVSRFENRVDPGQPADVFHSAYNWTIISGKLTSNVSDIYFQRADDKHNSSFSPLYWGNP